MHKTKSHHGVLVLFFSAFLFSLFTAVNRFVPTDIGIFYQTLLRTGLMGLMFLAIGATLKHTTSIRRGDYPLLAFRGLLVGGDIAAFFIAANNLPLGTAIFLFYAGSIVSSFIYGSFILREKIDKIKIISLASALVGLVVIYLDNFSSLTNPYAFFAILAGVCFGLANSSSKNLTNKYSIEQINSIAYLIAAALSAPLIFISKEPISFNLPVSYWGIFIAFAALGVAAYYTAVYGYKYVEAQKASLILLTEIIFVFILGLLFFDEAPTIKTIVGGILVIFASILPNIQSMSSRNKN